MSEDKLTVGSVVFGGTSNNASAPQNMTEGALNEVLSMFKDHKPQPLAGRVYSISPDQAVIDEHSGAIYMGAEAVNAFDHESIITQLATLLGCPIEALTVENLERAIGAARIVCNALNATADKKYRVDLWRIDQLKETLAPFERGA